MECSVPENGTCEVLFEANAKPITFLDADLRFWITVFVIVVIGATIAHGVQQRLIKSLSTFVVESLVSAYRPDAAAFFTPLSRRAISDAIAFAELQCFLIVFDTIARLFYGFFTGISLSGTFKIESVLLVVYYLGVAALYYGTHLSLFFHGFGLLGRIMCFGLYAFATASLYLFTGPLSSACSSHAETMILLISLCRRSLVLFRVMWFGVVITAAPLLVTKLALLGRHSSSMEPVSWLRQILLMGTNAIIVIFAATWNLHLSNAIIADIGPDDWCHGNMSCLHGADCGAANATSKPHLRGIFRAAIHCGLLLILSFKVFAPCSRAWTLLQNKATFFRHRDTFSLAESSHTRMHLNRLMDFSIPGPISRALNGVKRVICTQWPPSTTTSNGLPDTDLLYMLLQLMKLIEGTSEVITATLESVRSRSLAFGVRAFIEFKLTADQPMDLSGIQVRCVSYTHRSVLGGLPLPKFMWRRKPIFDVSLHQLNPWKGERQPGDPDVVPRIIPLQVNFRVYTAALCRLWRRVERAMKLPPSLCGSFYWRHFLNQSLTAPDTGTCSAQGIIPPETRALIAQTLPDEARQVAPATDQDPQPAILDDGVKRMLDEVQALRSELGEIGEMDDTSSVAAEDEGRDAWEVDEGDSLFREWQRTLSHQAAFPEVVQPIDVPTGQMWLLPRLSPVIRALVYGDPLPSSPLTAQSWWYASLSRGLQAVRVLGMGQDDVQGAIQGAVNNFVAATAMAVEATFGKIMGSGLRTEDSIAGNFSTRCRRFGESICSCFVSGRQRKSGNKGVAAAVASLLRGSSSSRNVFGVHAGQYIELELVIKELDVAIRLPLLTLDGDRVTGLVTQEAVVQSLLGTVTSVCRDTRDETMAALARQSIRSLYPPPVANQLRGQHDFIQVSSTELASLRSDLDRAIAALLTSKSQALPEDQAYDFLDVSTLLLRQYHGALAAAVGLFVTEKSVGNATAIRCAAVDTSGINSSDFADRLWEQFITTPKRAKLMLARWNTVHASSKWFLLALGFHYAESYVRVATQLRRRPKAGASTVRRRFPATLERPTSALDAPLTDVPPAGDPGVADAPIQRVLTNREFADPAAPIGTGAGNEHEDIALPELLVRLAGFAAALLLQRSLAS